MFRQLLVPLDGSALAEAALPVARALAARLRARVTLFHIVERGAPSSVHGERHLRDEAEAQAYLDRLAEALRAAGIEAEAHLHRHPRQDVAASILDHAEELSADLIVLATHGRGGLRDILFGSIAQQVVRGGDRPVLLVRPGALESDEYAIRRIVVPLDARPSAEAALPIAGTLAQAFGAELRLVVVVPTADTVPGDQAAVATLVPRATASVLDLEADTVARYLSETLARLAGDGVEATAEVHRGRPAETLARMAADWQADLVVLATHGRAGIDALLSASVGARLIALLKRPLLLVRVP